MYKVLVNYINFLFDMFVVSYKMYYFIYDIIYLNCRVLRMVNVCNFLRNFGWKEMYIILYIK